MSLKQNCYVWIRVSSREQEQSGYSLQAQEDIITKYLDENNLIAKKRFIIQETASFADQRTKFKKMFEKLQADSSCFILVAHKVDRLARNLHDSSDIRRWIDSNNQNQIHIVHEKIVINKDSSPHLKFIFNIHSSVANLTTDNLSQEVRKGMLAKAEAGYFPGRIRRGYIGKIVSDGTRTFKIAIPDQNEAPIFTKMFEWYSTGRYSISDICKKLQCAGIKTKKWGKYPGGKIMGKGMIGEMLKDIYYTGDFKFKGGIYSGHHEPIIDKATFAKVQETLKQRQNGFKLTKQKFLFGGMVKCGQCGCAVCGDKTTPYIYYRCTLSKNDKGKEICNQRSYAREEDIEARLLEHLEQINLPDHLIDGLKLELEQKCKQEIKCHQLIVNRLGKQKTEIEEKISGLVDMRTGKEIQEDDFRKFNDKYKQELQELEARIDEHNQHNGKYYKKVINQLDMVKNPVETWHKLDLEEKRKLLFRLFKKMTLLNKKLYVFWNKPFDLLVQYKKTRVVPVVGK